MTHAEMTRRLAEMTEEQQADIATKIEWGYSAVGIHQETGVPLRLVNAMMKRRAA